MRSFIMPGWVNQSLCCILWTACINQASQRKDLETNMQKCPFIPIYVWSTDAHCKTIVCRTELYIETSAIKLEEIEKQRAHERYMRLQEQGKTEQSRKDLERLALIRRQRAEAAKKRQEEKAAKELKRAETETDLPPAFLARDKKGALRSQS
ncbi:uncharacterized protein LOC135584939 isoform X3 [Musa acuminata AAA Group]|uniref:uncharacterized protein LOC135584939 isoform X3 n=1 Tax=Musa acuminata AAA Group TaxID=214697 RepID=UPI0031D6A88C